MTACTPMAFSYDIRQNYGIQETCDFILSSYSIASPPILVVSPSSRKCGIVHHRTRDCTGPEVPTLTIASFRARNALLWIYWFWLESNKGNLGCTLVLIRLCRGLLLSNLNPKLYKAFYPFAPSSFLNLHGILLRFLIITFIHCSELLQIICAKS